MNTKIFYVSLFWLLLTTAAYIFFTLYYFFDLWTLIDVPKITGMDGDNKTGILFWSLGLFTFLSLIVAGYYITKLNKPYKKRLNFIIITPMYVSAIVLFYAGYSDSFTYARDVFLESDLAYIQNGLDEEPILISYSEYSARMATYYLKFIAWLFFVVYLNMTFWYFLQSNNTFKPTPNSSAV